MMGLRFNSRLWRFIRKQESLGVTLDLAYRVICLSLQLFV